MHAFSEEEFDFVWTLKIPNPVKIRFWCGIRIYEFVARFCGKETARSDTPGHSIPFKDLIKCMICDNLVH